MIEPTHITRIQNCRILLPNLRKNIPLITQQSVHIPNMPQVLLVPRRLTYRLPPLFNQLENAVLHARRVHGRAFGEAAHELVEELLGADLEVEWVTAVLDADIEELARGK